MNVAELAASAVLFLLALLLPALAGPTIAALARVLDAPFPSARVIPPENPSLAILDGVRPLLTPIPPRFMMLAGVTGVRLADIGGVGPASAGVISVSPEAEGGAGGGIDKSTGLGVSFGTSRTGEVIAVVLPLRERVFPRKSGVELALFDVRTGRLDGPLLPADAFPDADIRIAEGCVERFRLGLSAPSSPPGDAVRFPEAFWPPAGNAACAPVCAPGCPWVAPNHGLVSGEMSKSRSLTGGAVLNTRFAGAEFHMCGGRCGDECTDCAWWWLCGEKWVACAPAWGGRFGMVSWAISM